MTRGLTVTPLHDHYSPAHLVDVVERMRVLGRPRIRAYFDRAYGVWFALEGTHRLRAAKALGLVPVLVPVPWPRSAAALERARFAAVLRAHTFDTLTGGARNA